MVVEDEMATAMELEELLVSHGYRFAGAASSCEEAVSMAKDKKPDLILMDIKLPGKGDGIDAAKRIGSESETPLVFLTGHSDRTLLARAKQANPLGYILKPLNENQIISAIEIALNRAEREAQSSLSHQASEVTDHLRSFSSELAHQYPDLTRSELTISRLITQGMTNKEMAAFLNLARGTVEWHRKNIRKKLGLTNKKASLASRLFSINA
jgi:DNA-binding NarL/FixJ family response regulator